ncbi:hypothetical protein [Microbispora rosea]|uniref:hypothetical protein n=1 Tax=Microbispora rosea TaxID=58117 RepID=UPI0034133ED8
MAGRVPPRAAHRQGRPERFDQPADRHHVIYALALIVLAAAYAGHTWGRGRRWAKLPFVQRNRWLI